MSEFKHLASFGAWLFNLTSVTLDHSDCRRFEKNRIPIRFSFTFESGTNMIFLFLGSEKSEFALTDCVKKSDVVGKKLQNETQSATLWT